jgi:WD40 repeat protein
MPAIISVVKSACIILTGIAAVFSASQIDYPTAIATATATATSPSTSSATLNPELQKSFGLALKISQIRFSPDSKSFAVLAGDRFISTWPVAGGNPTASILMASMPLTCIEWDPTGNQLYLGTSKSQILSCNPATLDIQFRIHSDIEIIQQIQLVSGPESLLSLGNLANSNGKSPENLPQLWHEDIHSRPQNIPSLHYISMSKHAETGVVALGAYTGEIVVFNPLSNSESTVIAKINSPIDALNWSGKTLIATSEGAIHLINSSNSQFTKTIQISNKLIRSVEIAKDGKTFFLSSGSNAVQIRDINSGDLICKLASTDEMISSIALSPDGKTLAVGTCQGNVTLWNTSDYQIRTIIPAGIN